VGFVASVLGTNKLLNPVANIDSCLSKYTFQSVLNNRWQKANEEILFRKILTGNNSVELINTATFCVRSNVIGKTFDETKLRLKREPEISCMQDG
jgi:hypothetical protein